METSRAGEQLALAPAPATNRVLGRLVEIVRGEFETSQSRRALRSVARRHEVRERVLSRIQAEPALLERAGALGEFAG